MEVPIVSDSVCEAASSDSVTLSSGGQCVTQAFNYNGEISSDMVCASPCLDAIFLRYLNNHHIYLLVNIKIIHYKQQTRFAPGLQARTLAKGTVADHSL